MGALKTFGPLCGTLGLALGISSALAAPPIDVTRPETVEMRTRSKKMPQIRDEDLVFQDVNDPPPKIDKFVATARVDIIGRALPNRNGKALLRLSQFDKVKILRESRDGRWIAVQAGRSGRKAWVPKVALRIPAVPKAPDAKPAPAQSDEE